MGAKKIIIWSLVVITIGYLGHVEYPEDCDFPIRLKIFYSAAKLAKHLNGLIASLGGSYLTFYRIADHDFSSEVDGVSVTKHVFGGVPTTIFMSTDAVLDGPRPTVIYYHGGGWVLGSSGMYAIFMKAIIKQLGIMVIFPEYRHAPENPYPIPLHDCVNATISFLEQTEKFQVDKNKIIVVGDSAGGNLAPAVLFHLRKRMKKPWMPCHLNLIYPVLQMSNHMLPSYMQNKDPPLLTPSQMPYFFLHYIGLQNETDLIEPMRHNLHMEGIQARNFAGKISSDLVPERFKRRESYHVEYQHSARSKIALQKYKPLLQSYASDEEFAPLSASDELISSLPKTHIITCEYDVLRDDGIILHERMKALGMDVTFENLEFAPHGILHIHGGIPYHRVEDAISKLIERIKNEALYC